MWTTILAFAPCIASVELVERLPALLAQEDAARASAAETWEALEAEYGEAVRAWAEEWAARFEKDPGATPAESPARGYWERYEALAAAGEGRAVAWLVRNVDAAPTAERSRETRLAALFERVRSGSEAPWALEALATMAARHESLDEATRGALAAHLEALTAAERGADAQRVARLGLADLARADAVRALALRLRAFSATEIADLASLSPAELDAIATEVQDAIDAEGDEHFARWYVQTDAGWLQQPTAPPAPGERYRPILEELAKAGSPRASVWYVSTIWHTTPDVVALKSRCLDVISAAELDADLARRFGFGIEGLVRQLGAATVEPKVLALAERGADETRVSLLCSLAVALCETARDDAQRERGIALLRQVVERWPDGDYAKGAEGKLFRYTKLLVGQPAPDFEASDVDGNAFRLSDYAGKVTVIDFWGFW